MAFDDLIADYLAGPQKLRAAVAGLNREQLRAQPVAGKWSTHQCVCHIADFEPVYLDRIKRVIAQDEPTMFGGDPDLFAAKLYYDARDTEAELQLIAACRAHLGAILKQLAPADFQRTGIHNEAGPLTLEKLLRNVTNHIPHHIAFIEEKRKALGA
jgi:uncharacterized damage-inducible protein DinB